MFYIRLFLWLDSVPQHLGIIVQNLIACILQNNLSYKRMISSNPENIIISRADSIGDVVLTLPVASVLKEQFPKARIIFLGKEYTRQVIEACANIDEFLELESFLHS